MSENTGRLVEPKNVEQLTRSIAELIESKDLREKLGRQGQESVKERFTPQTMVDTVEKIYKKLLEKKTE